MRKLILSYCLLAGLCDAATGALLVASPGRVLVLMRVGAPPAEPVYLRFIGVFVASVGLAYLYPLVFGAAGRLAVVFEVTALVRAAVALFVTVAVAAGALTPPWLSVAFTDAAFAVLQLGLLRKGALNAV